MLNALRGRHRLLGIILLFVLTAGFGQCLLSLPGGESAMVAAAAGMDAKMPCPERPCPSMQAQLPTNGSEPLLPAGSPLLPLAVLSLAGLLAFSPRNADAFPPLPLLPARSSHLRFYRLRI